MVEEVPVLLGFEQELGVFFFLVNSRYKTLIEGIGILVANSLPQLEFPFSYLEFTVV